MEKGLKEKLLEQMTFWEYMTEPQRQVFLDQGRILTFRDKELIYSPARECLGLILMISGTARVYLTGDDGRRATVFRLRKEDSCVLSMSCLLSAITFDVEIEAEEECSLLLIPSRTFAMISKENVYVENFSYKVVTEHFSDVMQAVQQLLFMSLEQRIAAFLLDESAAVKSDEIVITQERLAESIGSAREAVSRLLKKLADRELLEVKRGVIRLLDKEGLYHLIL